MSGCGLNAFSSWHAPETGLSEESKELPGSIDGDDFLADCITSNSTIRTRFSEVRTCLSFYSKRNPI